jgi:hypothetical protein
MKSRKYELKSKRHFTIREMLLPFPYKLTLIIDKITIFIKKYLQLGIDRAILLHRERSTTYNQEKRCRYLEKLSMLCTH